MYHLLMGTAVQDANRIADKYLDRRHDHMMAKAYDLTCHAAGLVFAVFRLAIEVFAEGVWEVHKKRRRP